MEPPECYECGYPISAIWDAFCYLKKVKARAETNREVHVDMASIDPQQNSRLDDIFDILRIPEERYCCRMHLLGIATIHNF